MKAFAAPADVFARIMTPAFVQKSGLLRLATRATISPSPASGLYKYWNESAVPQMSLPEAFTEYVPLPSKVALPGEPTAPISWPTNWPT